MPLTFAIDISAMVRLSRHHFELRTRDGWQHPILGASSVGGVEARNIPAKHFRIRFPKALSRSARASCSTTDLQKLIPPISSSDTTFDFTLPHSTFRLVYHTSIAGNRGNHCHLRLQRPFAGPCQAFGSPANRKRRKRWFDRDRSGANILRATLLRRSESTEATPHDQVPTSHSYLERLLTFVTLSGLRSADFKSQRSRHNDRLLAAVRSRRVHTYSTVTDWNHHCQQSVAAIRHCICSSCRRMEDLQWR